MPDETTRGRIIAASVLLTVFLAGATSGALLVQALQRDDDAASVGAERRGPGVFRRGPEGRPGPDGRRGFGPVLMTERLSRQLDLSPDQERRIREILERRRAAADSILDALRGPMRAHLDSTVAEMRSVLTPEQRETWDRFQAEGGRRFRRARPPPP